MKLFIQMVGIQSHVPIQLRNISLLVDYSLKTSFAFHFFVPQDSRKFGRTLFVFALLDIYKECAETL